MSDWGTWYEIHTKKSIKVLKTQKVTIAVQTLMPVYFSEYCDLIKPLESLGVVSLTYNYSTQEADEGEASQVQGQPGGQREFQAKQSYKENLVFHIPTKKSSKEFTLSEQIRL